LFHPTNRNLFAEVRILFFSQGSSPFFSTRTSSLWRFTRSRSRPLFSLSLTFLPEGDASPRYVDDAVSFSFFEKSFFLLSHNRHFQSQLPFPSQMFRSRLTRRSFLTFELDPREHRSVPSAISNSSRPTFLRSAEARFLPPRRRHFGGSSFFLRDPATALPSLLFVIDFEMSADRVLLLLFATRMVAAAFPFFSTRESADRSLFLACCSKC